MNKTIIKKLIQSWFEDNRPDLVMSNQITDNFLEGIYREIKDDIQYYKKDEKEALYIILYEFLRIYYSSNVLEIIKEIIEEDSFRSYFKEFKKINSLYQSEISLIMNKVSKKRIIEKYGFNNDITNNEQLKDDLRKIIQNYINSNSVKTV